MSPPLSHLPGWIRVESANMCCPLPPPRGVTEWPLSVEGRSSARSAMPTISRRGESEMSIEATGAQPRSTSRFALASLAALGVVFGDIPLYTLKTLKTVLDYTGPHPDPAAVLGALS